MTDQDWYEKDASSQRIRQGDIISSVEYLFKKEVSEENREERLHYVSLPYVVVITQDCDLEQDFKERTEKKGTTNDKHIQSVIICPGYLSASLKTGDHLLDVDMKMSGKGGQEWKNITSNNHKRYHRLPPSTDGSIPDIILDFKHAYNISRDDIYNLYKKNYISSLKSPYREDVSQRFSNYISRIALPINIPKYEKDEDASL